MNVDTKAAGQATRDYVWPKATPVALLLYSFCLGIGIPYWAGFRASSMSFVTIFVWVAAAFSMIAVTWGRGKARAVAWLFAVVIVAGICEHEALRFELLGFERRVKQLVDAPSLRRWVDQNLLHEETEKIAENRRILPKDLPQEYSRIWELRPTAVYVVFNAGDERWEYLRAYCGGGM